MNLQRSLAFIIGILILVADFFTKKFVANNLPLMSYHQPWYPYGGVGVFENIFGVEFSIVHAINKGAAWGMFAQWQTLLMVIRAVLIGALILYFLFFNKKKNWNVPLALIIAGALGNIVDYFLYGHVIDMFHFNFWGYDYPVFNLADSAIFLGIASLFVITWSEKKTLETIKQKSKN